MVAAVVAPPLGAGLPLPEARAAADRPGGVAAHPAGAAAGLEGRAGASAAEAADAGQEPVSQALKVPTAAAAAQLAGIATAEEEARAADRGAEEQLNLAARLHPTEAAPGPIAGSAAEEPAAAAGEGQQQRGAVEEDTQTTHCSQPPPQCTLVIESPEGIWF